ncbi:MAG: hypothetical protein R3C68_10710 [Myxococcota bacterium]
METWESSPQRLLFIGLAVASSLMIFMTTDRCFGEADIRNAINLAQTLHSNDPQPSLPEAIVLAHPEITLQDISWSGTLTDNFYGVVRVKATVPAPGEVLTYLFDVSLTAQRIHPANDLSRRLMQGIREGALSRSPTSD